MKTASLVAVITVLLFSAGEVQAGNQPTWGAKPVQPAFQPRPVRPAGPAYNRQAAGRQQVRQPRVITWEGLWTDALKEVLKKYPIQVAGSVRGKQVCQVGRRPSDVALGPARPRNASDLGIRQILIDYTRALDSRRYGDATRMLGLFQDRLLCLNVQSAQALDRAMASYLFLAARLLKGRERDMALRGAFNPVLLVFDQIQYTGRSWSLPMLYGNRSLLRRAMAGFDGKKMGLWFYDYRSGGLIRRTFDRSDRQFIDGLMTALSRPGRFGNGACSILEMAATGFNCGGIPGLGGDGGGGGAAMPGRSGMLGCMTQVAMSAGLHGQMSCLVRAGGGGQTVPDATPSLQVRGVLDQACTMSEEGEGGITLQKWEDDPKNGAQHPESPDAYDRFMNAYDKTPGFLAGVKAGFDAVFYDTPEPASTANAGSAGGRTISGEKLEAMTHFDDDRSPPALQNFPEGGSSRRTVDGGGGGCGDATNAAARMASLFRCSGAGAGAPDAGGAISGQAGTGPRSMPAPGSGGGMASGGMSGPGACSMQSGGSVNVGLLGRQCQSMLLGPDQSCGGGTASPEIIQGVQRTIFSPNRPGTGARDPRPGGAVGGAPAWGGGGAAPGTSPFGGKAPGGNR